MFVVGTFVSKIAGIYVLVYEAGSETVLMDIAIRESGLNFKDLGV